MRIANLLALLLSIVALSGCASPLNDLDTGHCHAAHYAVNDGSKGAAWQHQAEGSPTDTDHPTARVYSWALHRAGGCVEDVTAGVDLFLDTNARGCGAIDMTAVNLTGTITLANATTAIPLASGRPSEGIREWVSNRTYTYPANALGDQPQAWNMSVHLIVPHDELFLVNFVDDCIRAAVTDLKLEAIDVDFKE